MKKIYLILIFIIAFFCFKPEVYAFWGSYNYNYEVTKLNKNSEGKITIQGWGILNAGVTDGKSPKLNSSLGSGDSSYCTGSKNNYYRYVLQAVPLDSKKKYDLNNAVLLGTINGSGTSLTRVMCQQDKNGSCVASKSPCYENVGWKFTFNESSLSGSRFSNGYIFYLTINSMTTGKEEIKKSVSFPLSIYKKRITGMETEYYDSNSNSILSKMKVTFVAYNAYKQKKPDDLGRCGDNAKFGTTYDYNVLGIENSGRGYYSYKLDTKCSGRQSYSWAPAPWIVPKKNTTSIVAPPDVDPVAVEQCSDQVTTQASSIRRTNVCSGEENFEGSVENSCTVDNYEYYSKKCYENNLNVKFSINDLNGGTQFELINGGGFTAKASVNTTFACDYQFDIERFREDYAKVVTNLDYYEKESTDWYINYNTKEKLDTILSNYYEQTNNLENWTSNYDFTKLTASLKVKEDGKSEEILNLIYDSNDLIHDKIDLNGDSIKENAYCQVGKDTNGKLQVETIQIDGHEYVINKNVRCGEMWQLSLSLPEVCLRMDTGEPDACDLSDSQLSGGKKYYVDINSLSGEVRFSITGLGYDGNWKFDLDNIDINNDGVIDSEICSYKVEGLLKDRIKFRQIDLIDPFLKSYDPNRTIGKNYLNSKYNFSNIINDTKRKDGKIWEKENPNYQYVLSKVNVKNIRRDTKEEGVSSYLGRSCYITNYKYVCDFTRNTNDENNKNNFFSDVKIFE